MIFLIGMSLSSTLMYCETNTELKNIATMVMSKVEEKEYPMNKLKPNYFCFKN